MSFIPLVIGVVGAMVFLAGWMHTCPECNQEAEKIRLPRSLKQALRGGWTCPHCGIESSR